MNGDKECRAGDPARAKIGRWWEGLDALEPRQLLAAVFWDGGGNGSSWDDPLNWSANALPAAADDVTIDVAPTPAITISSGIHAIRSLILAEALTITGGTLSVATTAAVSSVLTVNGGTISGGSWDLGGGQIRAGSSTLSTISGITVAGEISLPGGANLRISSGITLSPASVIRLSGATSNSLGFVGSTTLAAGLISFENTAALGFVGMVGSGTLTIGAAARVSGGRGVIGQNVFSAGNAGLVNQGLISATVSGATITINTSGAAVFTNPGALSAIGGGQLTVTPSTWTTAGSITAETGSTIALAGGWSNTGSLNVNGGTLALGGSFSRSSLDGLVRSGGSLNLTGTLNNSGGTLTLSAATGSLTLSGGTISGGSVVQSGGAVLVPTTSTASTLNGVIVTGDLVLESNVNLRLAGAFGLAAGSVLRLSGSGGNTLGFVPGASLVSGDIICEANGGVSTIGVTSSGNFTIAAGATIRGGAVTIGSLVFGGSGAVGFTNLGLIRAESAAAELKIAPVGGAFTNSGKVEAAAGATLNITGTVGNYSGQTLTGGEWRVLNGSTLLFGPGAIRTSNAAVYLEGNAVCAALTGLDTCNGVLTLGPGRPFSFTPALGVFTIGVNGSLVKAGAGSAVIPVGISLDNRGSLIVEGGSLQILGGVAQVLGLNLSGGTWRVATAATLDIPWATIRTLEAAVSLAGSAAFPAIASLGSVRGTLTLEDGFAFAFTPLGGVFTIETGGSLVKAGSGSTTTPAGVTLNNIGLVRVTGGTLSIAGPIAQIAGTTLNGGSWTVSGSGSLAMPVAITASDCEINLDGPDASFAAIGGLAVNHGALSLLGGRQWTLPSLSNSGTVSLHGGSSLAITGTLHNTGLMSIQDGHLTAGGGGLSSGEFMTGPHSAVKFGGNHQFASFAKLSGSGGFVFSGGTMTWSGSITATGWLTIGGANFVFATPQTTSGILHLRTGTITLDAPVVFTRAQIDGGRIEGQGNLTVGSRLDWRVGEIGGTGKLLVNVGSTLAITGLSPLVLDRQLENSGFVVWQSNSFRRLAGPVINNAGATLTLNDAGKWGESGGTQHLINDGTIKKIGLGSSSVGAVLTNSGMVRVEGGTLDLQAGGTHTGDFNVLSGGTLRLSGSHTLAATAEIGGAGDVSLGIGTLLTAGPFTAAGSLRVEGATALFQGSFTAGAVTVASGSVSLATGGSASSWWNGGRLNLGNKALSVVTTFGQSNSGTLALKMDGRAAGQFGRVTAGGEVALSGSLEVSWGVGYTPSDATPFDFITGSSRSGIFTASTIQSLGIYRTFVLSYQQSGVRLWVYAVGIEGP